MELFPSMESLWEEKKEAIGYPRHKLPLGWDEINREPYLIDISEPRFCMICSKRGDGKSHVLHGAMDRYAIHGHRVHNWHDKKSEYMLMRKPNPNYEADLKWEMRQCGIESRELFMPFSEQHNEMEELHYYSPEFCPKDGTEKFSFRMTGVSFKDWKNLMSIYSGHFIRSTVFKLIYDYLTSHRKELDEQKFTKKAMLELATNFKNILSGDPFDVAILEKLGVDTLMKELNQLWEDYLEENVFEGDVLTDFEELIGFGEYNTEINWQAFKEGLSDTSDINKDIYMAVLLSQLFEWAMEIRNRKIKIDILLALDEFQDIITSGKNARSTDPYTVRVLRRIVKEGREYGIHAWTAFQGELEKVPGLLLENVDLLILGSKNATRAQLNWLKDSYPELFGSKVNVLKFKEIPRHHFLAIDKHSEKKPFTVFMPYPYLSEHFTVRGRT